MIGYRGFFAGFIEEWSQFWPGYSWWTFHPLMIEFEEIMSGVEVTIIVLGIGFRARWIYRETGQVRDLKEQVDILDKQLSEPPHE